MKLITKSKFYLEFSKWVDAHDFDEFGRPLKKDGSLLNGNPKSNGYPSTILIDNNGRKRSVCIHKIVANLFLENYNNYNTINHKNGDKTDFRVSNLEWCSRSFNTIHSYKAGLRTPPFKEIVAFNPLSGEEKIFKSIKECAEYFSVRRTTISLDIRRNSKCKGWVLRYKESQNTLSNDEFLNLLSTNEIKEHPIYKGYYASFKDSSIISNVKGNPRLLAKHKNDAGYFLCTIRKYNKTVQLHRFLYECYNEIVLSKYDVIDHYDENPQNNDITNLKLSTHIKNIQRSLHKPIIVEMNDEKLYFESANDCASYFGVSRSCVYNWISGHRTGFKGYGIEKLYQEQGFDIAFKTIDF